MVTAAAYLAKGILAVRLGERLATREPLDTHWSSRTNPGKALTGAARGQPDGGRHSPRNLGTCEWDGPHLKPVRGFHHPRR